MHTSIPLISDTYYHIYNRGNNQEDIFIEPRNYHHFLQLYSKHIGPFVHTYAYCLLKNHFHFFIRVKSEQDIKNLTGLGDLSGFNISQPFSNFFNAYSKAINHAYGRSGSLFQRPFHRNPVTSNSYFIQLVTYIHRNPQKHGFVDDFRDWPHSSYRTILSTKPTQIERDTILDWFSGRDAFIEAHQQAPLDPDLTDPDLTGFWKPVRSKR